MATGCPYCLFEIDVGNFKLVDVGLVVGMVMKSVLQNCSFRRLGCQGSHCWRSPTNSGHFCPNFAILTNLYGFEAIKCFSLRCPRIPKIHKTHQARS